MSMCSPCISTVVVDSSPHIIFFLRQQVACHKVIRVSNQEVPCARIEGRMKGKIKANHILQSTICHFDHSFTKIPLLVQCPIKNHQSLYKVSRKITQNHFIQPHNNKLIYFINIVFVYACTISFVL